DPELDQAKTLPTKSVKVTIVLLNEAWICTKPLETTFFSFFLKVFFFAVFAGAFAIEILYVFLPVAQNGERRETVSCRSEGARSTLCAYHVFADAFFLLATVPRRGPLRVRALVCVR